MKWVILLAGVVVVCFVAALVLGLVGGGMGGATSTLRHQPLPEERLRDDDLAALELDVTARGYRMSQVDGVLDRLRRELRDRDEEIASLRRAAEERQQALGEQHPAIEERPPE
ncbi:MAG TPA: cell division protein DivIVA [Intrasporangium sp.]|uniref:cell division protein DivIVA n=1 Tax=Intrasporangium sp. TaxID=1925024 RepID=UPI002D76ED02|nr:cell division protein DivIVA [Intrasporangium sp.]HET7398623.1 cell division protein DivIVA [Intrasporangium sp.]